MAPDRCVESNQTLIQRGSRAACPGCGNMVVVTLVDGVWTFPLHTQRPGKLTDDA